MNDRINKNQNRSNQAKASKSRAKGSRSNSIPNSAPEEVTAKSDYNPKIQASVSEARSTYFDRSSEKLGQNDFDWYNSLPELTEWASRIKVGYPLGMDIKYSNDNYSGNAPLGAQILPGIMQIPLLSGPGIVDAIASPATRAMDQIMTTMRYHKRGRKPYDPQDLYIYLLTLGELLQMYELARRAIGILNGRELSYINLYEYRAIITAAGWDYDDLIMNKHLLIARMEEYAKGLVSWRLPDGFKYFNRVRMLYSTYYADDSSETAQSYIFVPAGYRIFDATSQYGGNLKFHSLIDNNGNFEVFTVSKWLEVFESMYIALRNNDIYDISADIDAVYQGSYFIEPLDPNYVIRYATYDALMLTQIRNATLVGKLVPESANIDQDPSVGKGIVKYCPKFKTLNGNCKPAFIYGNRLYSVAGSVDTARTPECIFEATRLMNIPIPDPEADEDTYMFKHAGTEIALHAKIFVFAEAGQNLSTPGIMSYESCQYYTNPNSTDLTGMKMCLNQLSLITKFNNHPSMNIILHLPTADIIYNMDDVNTYGVINPEILDNLHRVAILSLWKADDLLVIK